MNSRSSPSGPVMFETVLSGTATIPAGNEYWPGPVIKRDGERRYWCFVFIKGTYPSFASVVMLPSKDVGLAANELMFTLAVINGKFPFDVEFDYTIVGVVP